MITLSKLIYHFSPCKVKIKARLCTLISSTQHFSGLGLFIPFNSATEYLSIVFYMVKLSMNCFFVVVVFLLATSFLEPDFCSSLDQWLSRHAGHQLNPGTSLCHHPVNCFYSLLCYILLPRSNAFPFISLPLCFHGVYPEVAEKE